MHQTCSITKAVLKNFVLITGKHPCWSLFLIVLQTISPVTLLKRGSREGVFLLLIQNF